MSGNKLKGEVDTHDDACSTASSLDKSELQKILESKCGKKEGILHIKRRNRSACG